MTDFSCKSAAINTLPNHLTVNTGTRIQTVVTNDLQVKKEQQLRIQNTRATQN